MRKFSRIFYLLGFLLFSHAAQAATKCEAPYKVGVQTLTVKGVNVTVWYPTTSGEKSQPYKAGGINGRFIQKGKINACRKFPLVVFSHGFTGCSMQSLFFTEELARRGYVVAAPDHADSLCDASGFSGFLSDTSFFAPQKWTSKTYAYRRNDVENVVKTMTSDRNFKKIVDSSKIGLVGHSLGGYTAAGIGGGWSGWKDKRVKGLLLFSPYMLPFLLENRISGISAPVMYQGGELDNGITPWIDGKYGAYSKTASPKYFVNLKEADHFAWTDLSCIGRKSLQECISKNRSVALINKYGFAFLDRVLKGKKNSLLTKSNSAVATFRWNEKASR